MPFYKLEFTIGLILIVLGITSLVFLMLNGGIVSIGIIIPFILLAVGAYTMYLAFNEPKIREE